MSLTRLATSVERCIYIEPADAVEFADNRHLVDDWRSRLLLGRQLSFGELCGALRHKRAIERAYDHLLSDTHLKWVVFAEDDADLNHASFMSISAELTASAITKPSLVNYYSAEACSGSATSLVGGSRSASSLVRERHWLAGAVCYAINRSGVSDLVPYSKMIVDYVPDWPVYYSRLDLYRSRRTYICESASHSLIGPRSNLKLALRVIQYARLLRHLGSIAVLYRVSRYTVFRHLIATPIRRDFGGRVRRIVGQPNRKMG